MNKLVNPAKKKSDAERERERAEKARLRAERAKAVLPVELEPERIIPLSDVEAITSLSIDSLERHHQDKIIRLTKRRRGMRLKHALALSQAP